MTSIHRSLCAHTGSYAQVIEHSPTPFLVVAVSSLESGAPVYLGRVILLILPSTALIPCWEHKALRGRSPLPATPPLYDDE